jgi:hypothetical protein
MDTINIQDFMNFGLGAVFAITMFIIYRKDKKDSEAILSEAKKKSEASLVQVVNDYHNCILRNSEVGQKQIEVMTELTTLIRMLCKDK